MVGSTKVVCLIGSSRFKATFHLVAERLEKAGCLALMMGFFGHADGRPISDEERQVLRAVDRARISLADEVWVVNDLRHWCPRCQAWKDTSSYRTGQGMGWHQCPRVGCAERLESRGYLGDDTRYDVADARNRGKPLRYLTPQAGCSPFDYAAVAAEGVVVKTPD